MFKVLIPVNDLSLVLPSSDPDETEKFLIFRNDASNSNAVRMDLLDEGTLTTQTLNTSIPAETITDSVLVNDKGKGFVKYLFY